MGSLRLLVHESDPGSTIALMLCGAHLGPSFGTLICLVLPFHGCFHFDFGVFRLVPFFLALPKTPTSLFLLYFLV